MTKRLNKREQHKAAVARAMPDVKALVRKHGRAIVANCVNKLREYDRELAKLTALRRHVAEQRRKLRENAHRAF